MAECRENGSPQRRRKVSVPKVRTVLKQIGDELSNDELEKLLFLAADHIPKSKTQGMNALNFFLALEERQLIDTKGDDVDYLLELLGELPRVDLVKKLKSTQPPSNYREKVVNEEEIIRTDTVVVANANTLEINANTWSVKRNKVYMEGSGDGGFLQDPNLVQSIFQKYNDTVCALEQANATNVELKKKNHQLKFEIDQLKDDQNNLIRERNSALGAKSEYVFKESELKKELSDLKRMNNLLGKNATKDTNTIEARDKEIAELKESLKKSVNTANELRSELEKVHQEKIRMEEVLAKFQKVEEANGRVTCKRCGLVYVEANNPVDACRYHSGQFGSVGALKKKMEWSCCRNTNKNAPGCCKKKHLTIDYPLPSPDLERKFTM